MEPKKHYKPKRCPHSQGHTLQPQGAYDANTSKGTAFEETHATTTLWVQQSKGCTTIQDASLPGSVRYKRYQGYSVLRAHTATARSVRYKHYQGCTYPRDTTIQEAHCNPLPESVRCKRYQGHSILGGCTNPRGVTLPGACHSKLKRHTVTTPKGTALHPF